MLWWCGLAWVWSFTLQIGARAISDERDNVESAIEVFRPSTRYPALSELYKRELEAFRRYDRYIYCGAIVAPIIVSLCVATDRTSSAMALRDTLVLALLLFLLTTLVLLAYVGTQLVRSVSLVLNDTVTVHEFKDSFALLYDVRKVMLLDGMHGVALVFLYSLGLMGAMNAISGLRSGILLVAAMVVGVLLLWLVALAVPFYLGYRATIREARHSAASTSTPSMEALDAFELELVTLRPPLPMSESLRVVLPVFTGGGVLLFVATKLLDVALK
jgi:hypothetical protein